LGQGAKKMSYLLLEYPPFGKDQIQKLRDRMTHNEILARTFVHHLVDGAEYLHKKGFEGLNLCPEKLFFGSDFRLKIDCYDLLFKYLHPPYEGVEDFRAPEIINERVKDYKASDIYSIGVIVFMLVTGTTPYNERIEADECDMMKHFNSGAKLYWELYDNYANSHAKLSNEFKDFVMKLVCKNPLKRMSFKEMREHPWYKAEVYQRNRLEKFFDTTKVTVVIDPLKEKFMNK